MDNVGQAPLVTFTTAVSNGKGLKSKDRARGKQG
jgi:hypothetical protein